MKLFILLVLSFGIFGYSASNCDVNPKFRQAKLIPDIIDDNFLDYLEVVYGQVRVFLGTDLTEAETSYKPTVDFKYKPGELYTLIMTESIPLVREIFLWVVGNIPGDRKGQGEEILSYLQPLPPPGTKPHPYTFLLYRQPGTIQFERSFLEDLTGRIRKARDFAQEYKLGNPIAGNFFVKGADLPLVHGKFNVL